MEHQKFYNLFVFKTSWRLSLLLSYLTFITLERRRYFIKQKGDFNVDLSKNMFYFPKTGL